MSAAVAALPEIATSSDHCLRWRDGAHSWRHRSDGGFDPARYTVAPIAEATAKAYTCSNHYSRSYPAASQRIGLFDLSGDLDAGAPPLVGVAVFGIPVQASVLTSALPGLEPYRESLELSRFVLDQDCPANSESWFLGRCFTELLATGVRGVVSFADPVPRLAADGSILAPGHVGTIYQASNALYTGRATARTLVLAPDGTVINSRSMQKVRRQDQGHEYVERKLIGYGARVPRAGEDMTAWLATALDDIGVRRIRHRGAHRYVFRLGHTARVRDRIRVGLPVLSGYPKAIDLAA